MHEVRRACSVQIVSTPHKSYEQGNRARVWSEHAMNSVRFYSSLKGL